MKHKCDDNPVLLVEFLQLHPALEEHLRVFQPAKFQNKLRKFSIENLTQRIGNGYTEEATFYLIYSIGGHRGMVRGLTPYPSPWRPPPPAEANTCKNALEATVHYQFWTPGDPTLTLLGVRTVPTYL